jgi:hypothetical protein
MTTTAVFPGVVARASQHERVATNAAGRLAGAAVQFAMLWLIFVPEYSQGGGDTVAKSPLYHTVAGNLRLIDLFVLFTGVLAAFTLGCSRRRQPCFPRKLTVLLAAFGVAIVVSLIYGMERDGRNLFFDWRAIVLGFAFYFVYRFWNQTALDVRPAISVFVSVVAIRIVTAFFYYARGQGDDLLGLRIPLFDGPSISAIVFASILGISLACSGSTSRQRSSWLLFGTSAALLVALCFRRTYWAELAIGLMLLAISARGHRMRILVPAFCAVAIAFLVLGGSLTDRLSSIDFTHDDTPYAENNADHVGDLLDAWAQVRASPITGIGLGRSYETWHIRNWKEESVMVHNAPLHVWLKYGLLGLSVYLAYHLCLFHSLRSQARRLPLFRKAVVNAVLAYLGAQFVVSLAFTPWPYSAVQSTNLIAFLMAIAFVREPSCHSPASPLSPRHSMRPLIWKTQSSA